jgi:hypothetical protein
LSDKNVLILSKSLGDAVVLGCWLDNLSKMLRGEFNRFISDHIKYGARWVHKLRALSRLFCKYKRLQELSLTISQASQLVTRVKKAIDDLEGKEKAFWYANG